MTKSPGAHGKDLAVDLLADLNRPLPVDPFPKPPSPLTAVDSLRSAATRETRSRGPALEGSVRISPLDWRKPTLSIGLQAASISFGPLRAELGFPVG